MASQLYPESLAHKSIFLIKWRLWPLISSTWVDLVTDAIMTAVRPRHPLELGLSYIGG